MLLTIQPAAPNDIVQVLLDSYGLTARETEIALCVCRALSTKDIAAELIISAHTVRDHIKVILAKAGVASRGELMAKLLNGHMFDRFHANTTHLPEIPEGHSYSRPHGPVNCSNRVTGSKREVSPSVP